jgi:LysR family transcriptional regulator of abg operon
VKVQHIQTLVAIADAGSLRSAAEVLGKSQPALTKALRQAEDDLGVPIFQRSSRGVVLTELGERILTRARVIASEIDRLDDEVAQLRGEQVGSIHVCVSPLAAVKIMPQTLARFHAKFPKIDIHLTSGLFPNALKPLRDGRTDIVIGPTPPAGMARQISVEPLMQTPIVLITSKTSPYQKAKRLADLTEAHWIMIGAPPWSRRCV